MRSRSATLTCPTQLYCSTASAGRSTRNSTATSAGPDGHLIFTSRSLTRTNRRKTLILKVLQSLQRLCFPLTTLSGPDRNNARHAIVAHGPRVSVCGCRGRLGLCRAGAGSPRPGRGHPRRRAQGAWRRRQAGRREGIAGQGNGQGLDRVEGLNGNEAWEEIKFGGGVNFGDGGGGDFGGGGGGDFRGGGNRGGRAGGQPGAPQADGRGGQAPVDPELAKQQQLIARQTEVTRVLLAMLLTTDVPVRWIGTAVTPQATAEVLEIRTADGTPTRIMIDSKTSMPLMLQWTGVAQDPLAALAGRAGFGRRGGRGGRGGFQGGFPGGGQGRQAAPPPAAQPTRADALSQPTALQMFLSDYKTVNGIKLPHLMVRGAGDQITEEWIVKSYRINPNFNPETFSK